MKRKVLVVAAHLDDEVIGCGGTIARHAALGDDVQVLVVTRGDPELFPKDLVDAIFREGAEAHKVLGVTKLHCLDLPAPKLDTVPQYKLVDSIEKIFRSVQPDTVYIPHAGDIHMDHRAVHHAALVAARPINGCSINRLLSYETLSETEWAPPSADNAFIPTVFIDISQYLTRKIEAMSCYRNQVRQPPHPRSLETIESLAKLRGSTVSLRAAEAFMIVREIIKN